MSRPMHDAVAEQDFAIHEHREVLPWLDRVHDVGCAVGHLSVGELKVELHRVVDWLEHCLEDHAAWEEAWLYPAIDAHAGTPFATRTVRFEHQQIRNGVRHLSADQAALGHELTRAQADELRSRIFGLEAIMRAHVECEERVLLPLLDEDRRPEPVPAGG
jgi:hemerythrin-like domain-containing protein